MTVVKLLIERYVCQYGILTDEDWKEAELLEKDIITNAIMHALDEDGHTGDWKIKFANEYYNKINEGYDFSNPTRTRFFGDTSV